MTTIEKLNGGYCIVRSRVGVY